MHEFFCGYEAAVGFTSTYSAMLAAASGVAMGSGSPSSWDPYAELVDRIRDGRRVYGALRRMCTADVVVLYRLYGPRHAGGRPGLGELEPIVALTAAAELARETLVLRESTAREVAVGEACAGAMAISRGEIEELFWREARALARLPARGARAARRRAAGRAWMRQLLDAHRCDGTLRARLGAIAGSDREITVEHALRWRLDLAPRHDKDALREWRAARDAFVAEALAEAAEMRDAALDAYRRERRG